MLKVWKIKPSKLKGSIEIPSSKSQTMRALLFGLLARGKSMIKHPLPFPDMVHACRLLGATVEEYPDRLEVIGLGGKVNGAEDIIDAGNSGLILRFLGAIAALSSKPIVITGDYSVRHNRPMLPLLEGLSQLGAWAISLNDNGKAPICVRGPLSSGQAIIRGEDSQTVSGLLVAAAFAPGPVEIFVTNPGELPWVQLTLNWFKRLNIPYKATQNGEYYRLFGKATIEGFAYEVPGDFSSVAFPLAAALLTGSEVLLHNLDFNDPQGDKRLIPILQQMGAKLEVDSRCIRVKKGGSLQGMRIDINDCIDTLPILAVIACFAEGETELVGAGIARTKECDRIHAITTELKKMGARIEGHKEGLTIQHSPLKGSVVHSYHDHRIALALTVAGLAAKGETRVHEVACVSKTFPSFQQQMQALGAHITPCASFLPCRSGCGFARSILSRQT